MRQDAPWVRFGVRALGSCFHVDGLGSYMKPMIPVSGRSLGALVKTRAFGMTPTATEASVGGDLCFLGSVAAVLEFR